MSGFGSDIGETLESFSSESIGASSDRSKNLIAQATQRTDRIANSSLETRDDLAYSNAKGNGTPRGNRLILLTAALAVMTALAILIAAMLQNV